MADGEYLEFRTGLVYERIARFLRMWRKAAGSLGGSCDLIRGIDLLGGLEGRAFRSGRTRSDPPSQAITKPGEGTSSENPVSTTRLCARPVVLNHRNGETGRANPRRSRRHIIRRVVSTQCSRHGTSVIRLVGRRFQALWGMIQRDTCVSL